MYRAHRFAENPIVRPDMDPSIGTNLNGPSLIRVPDWIDRPLGRYYLYFANHQGKFIRLAYADDLHGPWRIHAPGVLHLDETPCRGHIASPEVVVDEARKELVLYFHGGRAPRGQREFHAVGADGLHFRAAEHEMGPFYMRVFAHQGAYYAVAKTVDALFGGVLCRSPDGRQPFDQGPEIIPRMRHAAVRKRGERLDVFFSRGEDCPERILAATMDLRGDWRTWRAGEPQELLAPEQDYEGAHLRLEPSGFGGVNEPVNQLRDPAFFEEDGRAYLVYSAAGESSLCMAELTEMTEETTAGDSAE